jgi:hypothetical protein
VEQTAENLSVVGKAVSPAIVAHALACSGELQFAEPSLDTGVRDIKVESRATRFSQRALRPLKSAIWGP